LEGGNIPVGNADADAVDTTPPIFTIDDLLAELKPDDIPDGVTVRELCERNGDSPTRQNMNRVQRQVYDLVARGLWEYVGKKRAVSVVGTDIAVPAYRPKGGNSGIEEGEG